MDPKDKSKVKGLNNDADACPRCCGKVYANEMMQSKGKCFHKDCFTCYDCEHILNVSTAYELSNEIFCKTCYLDRNSVGKNHYLDRNSIQALKAEGDNDTDACVRCKNKAFENERVMARSGPFHHSRVAGLECSRKLDISQGNDGRDGGVYCKNCYGDKYGHKGRSRSAIREVVFPAQEGDVICPGCNGKIFDAEKLLTQYGPFHTACFKCLKCEKSLVYSPAFKLEGEGEGLTLACKQCSQAEPSKTCELIAKAQNVIKAMDNDPDKCP
jgi:hypothetical protein